MSKSLRPTILNRKSRIIRYVCNEKSVGQCAANYLSLCEGIQDTGDARLKYGETTPRFVSHMIAARRNIFRSGEHVGGVPIICSGWAAVVASAGGDRRQILSFLLPGDLVSPSLVFEDKLDYSVEAITEVIYRSFNRVEFRAALTSEPDRFETILNYWTKENLQLGNLAVGLGQCSAEERIAQLILKLFDRLTVDNMVEDDSFYFPLRQQHIADYTGLTPVHVSNVLGQLRRDNLIEIEDRSITIRNSAALRRLCNI